ncbi:MAG: DUF47 domain-containing protein [Dehalococcoidia bacterium]
MLKFSFIPREERFFELFEDAAQNLTQSARLLAELVANWDGMEEKVKQISDLEHQGDTITHQIVAKLHRTFVTPLDREDILLLVQAIDDVVDLIHAAAEAMLIYKVPQPTHSAQELADILVEATHEVERAIPSLRHRKQLKEMLTHCVELNRLENKADEVCRRALGDLFSNSADVIQILKWHEIYEDLESAADRCEDIANVLEGVALKYG